MKKILLLLAVLSICALAAVAVKEPYVIGAVFDITGPGAPLGTPERDTVNMLVKKINADGGINGHQIKLVVLDNQSEEVQSVNAVKKLIESEKVIAIIGPSQTGTTLAVSQTIEAANIPLISCAAGVKIVDPVKPLIFKTAQSDVSAVAKVLTYCKSKKIKTLGIITVSNAFGDSGKNQLLKQAPAAGISIIDEESFGDKDTDMTSQLMKIRAKNPQAVVCWGTNPGPAMVAKNMKQLGIKVPLIMSHGIANRKFIDLAGDAAEGVIFPSGKLLVYDDLPSSEKQKKVLTAYANEYKAEYNKPADTFGGHAYDALMILKYAISKVGPNSLAIRNQIEKTRNFVGISGVFNFSPTDHNGLNENAFVMVTITNGDWKMAK